MTDRATAASIAVLLVGFVGALGAAFWSAPRVPAALPSPPHQFVQNEVVTLCDAIVARAGARAALSRATGIPVPTNLHPRGCPNE